MTTSAIVMMAFAILIIWGGLALAIVLMLRGTSPGERQIHRDL